MVSVWLGDVWSPRLEEIGAWQKDACRMRRAESAWLEFRCGSTSDAMV